MNIIKKQPICILKSRVNAILVGKLLLLNTVLLLAEVKVFQLADIYCMSIEGANGIEKHLPNITKIQRKKDPKQCN